MRENRNPKTSFRLTESTLGRNEECPKTQIHIITVFHSKLKKNSKSERKTLDIPAAASNGECTHAFFIVNSEQAKRKIMQI